jgi:hypothetical protein
MPAELAAEFLTVTLCSAGPSKARVSSQSDHTPKTLLVPDFRRNFQQAKELSP